MSYRKNHVKRKRKRIKPKKSIFRRLWFWILVLSFLIFCSFIYFFVFFPGFQVDTVIISGNEKIKTEELRQLVFENINTGLVNTGFFNLTSRSIFLVNPNNLSQKILDEFPIIKKVGISRNFPKTLILGVLERKPIGAYCVENDSEPKCFLLDENGIIFEELSVKPSDILIVRHAFGDKDGYSGKKVVEENITNALLKIQENLKDNFQIDIKEALITSSLRLNTTTSENWQIYFSLGADSDIDIQIAKLNLLLSGEISPESRKLLQYIDLRFKDRAYYK